MINQDVVELISLIPVSLHHLELASQVHVNIDTLVSFFLCVYVCLWD